MAVSAYDLITFVTTLSLAGCGGDVVVTDAGCGTPPSLGSGGATTNGVSLVFVVNQFYLGDTAWDGTPNADAWKDLGFNLDGVNTVDVNTRGCSISGAFTQDGNCGVDNRFGSLQFDFSDPGSTRSQLQTSWASSGRWTWLIKVDGYQPKGEFTGLSVQLYVGAPLTSAPRLDGTDTWNTASGMDSNVVAASVSDGVVTAAPLNGWIDEPLSANQAALHRFHAPLHASVLQMTVSSDQSSIARGVLAGVIYPEEIADLPCVGGDPTPAAQYSDISRSLGHDPSVPCDAWSFAIGFTAVRAQLGAAMPSLPAPTNCTEP